MDDPRVLPIDDEDIKHITDLQNNHPVQQKYSKRMAYIDYLKKEAGHKRYALYDTLSKRK